MKKTRKILLSVIALFLILIMTACQAKLVCLSHIDRDGNGKCDNCGIKLEDSSSKSNVKSLTVKVKPTKLEYAINEKLDVTGGVLLVTYNDGTADKEVPFTDSNVKITEPGMATKGKKMVAVSYEGKTATYTIEVGDAKYEVSFNMGYDSEAPVESQIIVINNKVTKPADPERSGFDFAGWYTSSDYTQLFDFEMTQIKEKTVIYAKWDNIYTVTYVANYEGGENSTGSTKNLKAPSKTLDDRDTILFTGWYTDAACTTQFNFNTNVTENLNLYAGWLDTVTKYDVSFNLGYDGATPIETQKVAENTRATKPTDPERSGYEFGGWYKESACTNEFNFALDTISANTTIYAKWNMLYTVSFNLGYTGGTEIESQSLLAGASATKPTDPERSGYEFGGWYKESACTNEFNFAQDTISANTTIYAKWFKTCTVTYNPNYDGATNLTGTTVKGIAENKILENRDKNAFQGWYKEAACTNAFDFTTVLEADITLYAKWVQIGDTEYDVTFNLGYEGAPTITPQKVVENTRATKPTADPERSGYTFAGWYKEAACTNVFNFNTELITANTTIYAKWNALYKVTFSLNYEGAPSATEVNVESGAKVEKPNDPARTGFTFGGWYKEAACTNVFNFNTETITANTTIYAKWNQIYKVTYKYNYTDSPADIVEDAVGGKAQVKVLDDRSEYIIFAGWSTKADGSDTFEFNTVLTENITLYAKWNDTTPKQKYTVSYNLNYTGAVNNIESQEVVDGLTASEPASPTRASISAEGHQALNFTFLGWCTDAECKNDFSFTTPITGNIELYAKWKALYLFEAEHTNLVDDDGMPIKGMGASGGSEGAEMVDSPSSAAEGVNASNGYYVTYLFAPGIRLKWVINSDRDIDNVTLIFRISCESQGFALTPNDTDDDEVTELGTRLSKYTITVNGESLEYPVIEITDAKGHEDTGDRRPFSDHILSTTVSLKKGENIITALTDNEHGMGGTMAATAPVIDCIKIEAAAELSWTPNLENEFGQ